MNPWAVLAATAAASDDPAAVREEFARGVHDNLGPALDAFRARHDPATDDRARRTIESIVDRALWEAAGAPWRELGEVVDQLGAYRRGCRPGSPWAPRLDACVRAIKDWIDADEILRELEAIQRDMEAIQAPDDKCTVRTRVAIEALKLALGVQS